ncbi:hypothetical protein CsSME_00037077 [Camellia sinensis var. sinensis]
MTQASISVPVFYVFGDSTVDAGNNNNIEDGIKANFYLCGIDYNNQSTGRFTNGLTAVDFMGIEMGNLVLILIDTLTGDQDDSCTGD